MVSVTEQKVWLVSSGPWWVKVAVLPVGRRKTGRNEKKKKKETQKGKGSDTDSTREIPQTDLCSSSRLLST